MPDTAYTIAHGNFFRSLPFLYDFSVCEAALRISHGSCGMTERLSLTLARRVWKNPEAGWASPKKEWSGKWLDWNGVAGINQSPTSPIDPSLRHVYKMCRQKEKQSFFFYLLIYACMYISIRMYACVYVSTHVYKYKHVCWFDSLCMWMCLNCQKRHS